MIFCSDTLESASGGKFKHFIIMPRKRYLILAVSFFVQGWKIKECYAKPPLALHRVIEVERGAEVVIRLDGFDEDGDIVSVNCQPQAVVEISCQEKIISTIHLFLTN